MSCLATGVLRLLFAGLVVTTTLGCASSTKEDTASAQDLVTTEYRLPGVSETVLVADRTGRASIVGLGDPTTVAPIERPGGAPIVAGRSFEKRFWLLDASGTLSVVDPLGVVRSSNLGVAGAADIEIERTEAAWVSTGAELVRVDTTTGSRLATIDFASSALDGGAVTASGIKRVGERLFVQLGRRKGSQHQRGAIAIIDLATSQLETLLELEVPNGTGTAVGYDPGGAMVVDWTHDKLLLTARGFRPSDTGMVLRIDLSRRTLDPWFFRSGAGFQGGLAAGATPNEIFIGYHTSTPVASTHLFHYRIADDGELESQDAGALLDAFEVVDDYPSNASSSLFALPVTCPAGFCLGGKGVSFIDTKSAKPHPRLGEAALRMSPSFVLFL